AESGPERCALADWRVGRPFGQEGAEPAARRPGPERRDANRPIRWVGGDEIEDAVLSGIDARGKRGPRRCGLRAGRRRDADDPSLAGERGQVGQPSRAHQPLGDIGLEPVHGDDDELSRLARRGRAARGQGGQRRRGQDPTTHVRHLILSIPRRGTSVGSCGAPGTGWRNPTAYTDFVRVLGIDYGQRRVGFALSDATGTLASPWRMMERPSSEAETVRLIAEEIGRLASEDDGLRAVVVGWPRRLDGSPT